MNRKWLIVKVKLSSLSWSSVLSLPPLSISTSKWRSRLWADILGVRSMLWIVDMFSAASGFLNTDVAFVCHWYFMVAVWTWIIDVKALTHSYELTFTFSHMSTLFMLQSAEQRSKYLHKTSAVPWRDNTGSLGIVGAMQHTLPRRRVWIYQRGNQNPYIEEEQTTQWPKEEHKDKQRSTKDTYKTKVRVTRTPLITRGELRCSNIWNINTCVRAKI